MSLFTRLLFCVVLCMGSARAADPAPSADHHQHLFSPPTVTLLTSATFQPSAILASDVIALLDLARIERAAILSTAYMYGRPDRVVEDEYAKVRAENDWVGTQVAHFPTRLRGFCGVNPLRDYALAELARCAANPHIRHGVKLHMGNSDVQLEDPAHLAQMRTFFAAANKHGMAIAIHLRASISKKRPYGADQARAFLDLLAAAPDVTVQVAHLASAGPGYQDPSAHAVMAVLAAAVEKRDPRTRKLLFDVASIVDPAISPENAALVARLIRQVGPERILYGTDTATGTNLRPRESWAAFLKLGLTDKEFGIIAANVAPYMR